MADLPKTCPKCGHKGWDGPTYRSGAADPMSGYQQRSDEWLEYRCIECGYALRMPCADAADRDEMT